ncbi:MAG: hypothetical protein R3C60_07175 [Parvularculaceae bacterium]
MKVGVSGHRRREGADWAWVEERMTEEVERLKASAGYTSLAPGADQLFAEVILARGAALISVIATVAGEIEIGHEDPHDFERICARSAEIIRVNGKTPDEAFMRAGMRVVEEADYMIIVWDGAPSRGLGGTADIADYAKRLKKNGVILDPIACRTKKL